MYINGLLLFLSKLDNGVEILFGLVILWKKVYLRLMDDWRLITSSTKILFTVSSLLETLLILISLGLFSWKLEFLNLSTMSNWLIDPLLFCLRLNSFMALFLNIQLRLLVHVLILISGMINGVLLLVYQRLHGYLMVLEPWWPQFPNFGTIVIGFPWLCNRWIIFLNISWLGRNMILLIRDLKTMVISLSNMLGIFSWIQGFLVIGVRSFDFNIFLLPKLWCFGKFFLGDLLWITTFNTKLFWMS